MMVIIITIIISVFRLAFSSICRAGPLSLSLTNNPQWIIVIEEEEEVVLCVMEGSGVKT